jgi:hypothetical protein
LIDAISSRSAPPVAFELVVTVASELPWMLSASENLEAPFASGPSVIAYSMIIILPLTGFLPRIPSPN